jgi:hypothetical protein
VTVHDLGFIVIDALCPAGNADRRRAARTPTHAHPSLAASGQENRRHAPHLAAAKPIQWTYILARVPVQVRHCA